MNWGTTVQSGVFVRVWQREREGVHMCNCAHDMKVDREAESWEGKERASVRKLLLRFGNGRFDSSTPISLLWHSSPLNGIDYWFCSLRLLWDFPSDSLCSKRSAEEKHRSLCVLPHDATSLIQMGRVTWKTLSLQQYTSQEAEGCHGANVEIKSKPLMWHIDLNESRVIVKCTCCFCIDLASQKRQGEPVW